MDLDRCQAHPSILEKQAFDSMETYGKKCLFKCTCVHSIRQNWGNLGFLYFPRTKKSLGLGFFGLTAQIPVKEASHNGNLQIKPD